MSGYMIPEVTIDSLRSFVEAEYDGVSWTNFAESSEEHRAIWGWNEDGTYEVALALGNENGWYVKVMRESEGPVIQPPEDFLNSRRKLPREVKSNNCMKLYFVNAEHEKAFNELKNLKDPSDPGFDYADYIIAYYVLTADKNLRTFLGRFTDQKTGDIDWGKMLESNIVYKDYRQVVAFAHQLYSGGWKNEDFDFIKLLVDVRGKQGVLNTVLEAARLYSSQAFLNRLV